MNMGSIWHRRHLINVNFPLTITQRIVVSSTTMLLLLLSSSQKVRWVDIESWIPGPYFYIYPSVFHSLKPCNFQFLQQKAVCTFAKQAKCYNKQPQSLSVLKKNKVTSCSPYNLMQLAGQLYSVQSVPVFFCLELPPHSAYLGSFTSSQWVTESMDDSTGGFSGSRLLGVNITPDLSLLSTI